MYDDPIESAKRILLFNKHEPWAKDELMELVPLILAEYDKLQESYDIALDVGYEEGWNDAQAFYENPERVEASRVAAYNEGYEMAKIYFTVKDNDDLENGADQFRKEYCSIVWEQCLVHVMTEVHRRKIEDVEDEWLRGYNTAIRDIAEMIQRDLDANNRV